MSFLCHIGLHSWKVVGWKGLVMPAQVQRCSRCRIGREVCFDATFTYTAEQMDSMLEKHRPSSDKACASIYKAASKGFHVQETCGPDGKYLYVSRFQSLEDLHAFHDALLKVMQAGKPQP